MKTSIHIEPVKTGSEQHNRREKNLDYVNKKLSNLNEIWSIDSIGNRLKSIKERYEQTTKQKMQTKSTPIREGVIVITQTTTMRQLKQYAEKLEKEFGIKTFQIYTHQDEGHKNATVWTPNLHAHMLFDWTQDSGKSLKLNKYDMIKMQDLAAECLGMERGVSSDKVHLSAIQFKVQEEERKLEKIPERIENIANDLETIETILEQKHLLLQQEESDVIQLNTKKEELAKVLQKQSEVEALKKADTEQLMQQIDELRQYAWEKAKEVIQMEKILENDKRRYEFAQGIDYKDFYSELEFVMSELNKYGIDLKQSLLAKALGAFHKWDIDRCFTERVNNLPQKTNDEIIENAKEILYERNIISKTNNMDFGMEM